MSFRLKNRAESLLRLEIRDLREHLAHRFFHWKVTTHAGDIGLVATRLRVFAAGTPWLSAQTVQDGLGRLGNLDLPIEAAEARSAARPAAIVYVKGVNLVATGRSRIRELSGEIKTIVKPHEPITLPAVQPVKFRQLDSGIKICSPCLIQSAGQVLSGGARFLLIEPGIHDGTRRMKFYPHARRSISLSDISLQIRESFLREGEVLKGISRQKGELLGVFRCVPVSMISKIRFLEQRSLILYTLDNTQLRSRMRIHDLAAIRNPDDKETHLVSHRTRYKTAFLG